MMLILIKKLIILLIKKVNRRFKLTLFFKNYNLNNLIHKTPQFIIIFFYRNFQSFKLFAESTGSVLFKQCSFV